MPADLLTEHKLHPASVRSVWLTVTGARRTGEYSMDGKLTSNEGVYNYEIALTQEQAQALAHDLAKTFGGFTVENN